MRIHTLNGITVEVDFLPLCKCNSCDGIFVDTNPQTDAKKHAVNHFKYAELALVPDEGVDNLIHACPVCKTDSYLVDL